MKQTIGEFLLRRIREAGVDEIFGVPGDFNLNLLEQAENVDGIEFVGTTNELNASYAADGYARIKGAGALLTTYGVGELSALCGVAGSMAEHVSVISVAGAPPLYTTRENYSLHHSLGDGNFINVRAAMGQFTVATAHLTPGNAVDEIDRCIRAALREKRPVHIQVPSDISYLEVEVPETPLEIPQPYVDATQLSEALAAATKMLTEAARPAVLIDFDAERLGLIDGLKQFIADQNAPFAALSSAKALMDERHTNYLGFYSGAATAPAAREAIEHSDALITTSPLWIETNSAHFTHNLPEHTIDLRADSVAIAGVAYEGVSGAALLEALNKQLTKGSLKVTPAPERQLPQAPELSADDELTQAYIWPRFAKFLKSNDVVIAESGTSSIGLGPQVFPKDVSYCIAGYWGAIGWSLPAVMGTKMADPSRRNILFIGDGSLQLTVQEISTMLREGVKPIIVIVNNHGYTIERYIMGMTRKYNDIAEWDYTALPEVFAPGTSFPRYKASTAGELDEALAKLEADNEGGLLEVVLDAFDAPEALRKFGPATAVFDFGQRGPENV